MALYSYTVIAGIIIWCGVVMGTWGLAGILVGGGGGMPKIPPICTKNAPQMEKKVAKMPPHDKISSP